MSESTRTWKDDRLVAQIHTDKAVDQIMTTLLDQMNALIEELAKAFYHQHESLHDHNNESYKTQLRDDIVAVAIVIHEKFPHYNMNLFYHMSGYEGTYPKHS